MIIHVLGRNGFEKHKIKTRKQSGFKCKKCKLEKRNDERVKANLPCGDCDYNLRSRECYDGV